MFFDHLRKPLRIFDHIRFFVVRPRQLHRFLESQPVFPPRRIPNQKPRHHRRIGAQRQPRQSRTRRRRRPKEIHENPFVQRRVVVHQNPDGPRLAQDLQNRPRRFILVDRPISRQAAITINQRVHPPVRHRPHQKMQRIAVQRMRERRKLPSTHVPGQKQHTFAQPLGRVEILKPIDHHDLLDVLPRIFRQLRKFPGQPADLLNHSPNDLLAPLPAPLRKRNLQIRERRPPQGRAQPVSHPRKAGPHPSRRAPRQPAQQLQPQPRPSIFNPLTHRAPLCKTHHNQHQRRARLDFPAGSAV